MAEPPLPLFLQCACFLAPAAGARPQTQGGGGWGRGGRERGGASKATPFVRVCACARVCVCARVSVWRFACVRVAEHCEHLGK